MAHQTITIDQPDNAWSTRLRYFLTGLGLKTDIVAGELQIGRTTSYRMLAGEVLPKVDLWLRIMRYIVLHRQSSLSWAELLAWDAEWAALSPTQQKNDQYRLLGQLFPEIPATLLVQMLHYLSNHPHDKVILPLIRDYQANRQLNQTTLRELEGFISEKERQADNQQTNETLQQIREKITAHQARLDEHQQRLDAQEQFLEQLTQLTQELSRQSQQLWSLTSTVAEMTSWRHTVDQSLTTLDAKIEAVSLQLMWKKFWTRIGYRLYGPLLQDRWHYVTEISVGILIIAILVGYSQLLPPTYRDKEEWQFGVVAVLVIIAAWEIGRTRLRR
jgi:hypothetical protein